MTAEGPFTPGLVAIRTFLGVALVCGVLVITATGASAETSGNWYVSKKGTSQSTSCSSKKPCKTIEQALTVQAQTRRGGTIHVAAGTYKGQVTATPVNDGVTIEGAASSDTVIEPQAKKLAFDTDTDSAQNEYYVVDVSPGTAGFDMRSVSVDGLNAIAFLGSDGYGCNQNYVGVYYHGATGSIRNVDVTGVQMPVTDWGCGGGLGIYVTSTPSDPADVTMTRLSITPPAGTGTITRTAVAAGTYTSSEPEDLEVAKVPSKFKDGQYVTIDGNGQDGGITATKVSSTEIAITGTLQYAAPKGSRLNYAPYTGSYDQNGITCDDQWTTCDISRSTIEGAGPTDGIAQNGVQFWGAASATLTDTQISQNSYTGGGGAGNAATGVLAGNDAMLDLTQNVLTDNDENIYAGELPAYSLSAGLPAEGAWSIEGNTVSAATAIGESAGEAGYGEGIWLDGADSTDASNTADLYGNTITTSAQAGILMTGDTSASIGTTANGNFVEANEAGIVVGGPSTQCEIEGTSDCSYGTVGDPSSASPGWGSSDNTLSDNTLIENSTGVVVEGSYEPTVAAYGFESDPNAAYSNDFNDNSWSSSTLANVVDFSGYGSGTPPLNQFGTDDPGSDPTNAPADSCEPYPGDSYSADSLLGLYQSGSYTSVPDSAVQDGSTAATTSYAGGFSGLTVGAYTTDSSGDIPNGTTEASSDTNDELNLSQAATGNSGDDNVAQGNYWAC